MYESCLQKQQNVKTLFNDCLSKEQRYHKIMELGRELPPFPAELQTSDHLVQGCQSRVFLHSRVENGKVFFEGASDALISAGLVSILLKVYNGEDPETILKCPPNFLDELQIGASLSPNRANGLYSMHLRMKQNALKHLLSAN